MAIGAENLHVLLSALGDELAMREAHTRLAVVGGGAMLARNCVERATRDEGRDA